MQCGEGGKATPAFIPEGRGALPPGLCCRQFCLMILLLLFLSQKTILGIPAWTLWKVTKMRNASKTLNELPDYYHELILAFSQLYCALQNIPERKQK